MTNQPAFQKAAVDRIVERFTSSQGARRFLLADEVGLGKTHVAQGVIKALAKKQRRPLVVFYISSSKEIAHQNRKKLVPKVAEEHLEDRLTLLAASVKAIRGDHSKGSRRADPKILTLTPGTSLFLSRSTGVQQERQLLLYFIRRVRSRLFTLRCRDEFRCGVKSRKAWRRATTWRALSHSEKFGKRTDSGLLNEIRKEWREPLKELDDWLSGRARKTSRGKVIGQLRRGLAIAVAKALQPGLIVLDEFQRFRDVIQARGPDPIRWTV